MVYRFACLDSLFSPALANGGLNQRVIIGFTDVLKRLFFNLAGLLDGLSCVSILLLN